MTMEAGKIISERGLHRLPAQTGLVIFDFDGVIADSEVISLSTLQEALAAYGIEMDLEEVRRRYLGLSADKIAQDVGQERPDAQLDTFRAAWHRSLFERFRSDLTPVDGVAAFLDRIDGRGMPFCIGSSSSFERLDVALGAMDMRGRFANVFSAQLVERGKPAPDLFLHAAEQIGVAAERCVVIEDSPFGIIAAREAGMLAVGFLGGSHLASVRDAHREKLLQAGADIVIDGFDEIVFQDAV